MYTLITLLQVLHTSKGISILPSALAARIHGHRCAHAAHAGVTNALYLQGQTGGEQRSQGVWVWIRCKAGRSILGLISMDSCKGAVKCNT